MSNELNEKIEITEEPTVSFEEMGLSEPVLFAEVIGAASGGGLWKQQHIQIDMGVMILRVFGKTGIEALIGPIGQAADLRTHNGGKGMVHRFENFGPGAEVL